MLEGLVIIAYAAAPAPACRLCVKIVVLVVGIVIYMHTHIHTVVVLVLVEVAGVHTLWPLSMFAGCVCVRVCMWVYAGEAQQCEKQVNALHRDKTQSKPKP